jgi:hypothetical protein
MILYLDGIAYFACKNGWKQLRTIHVCLTYFPLNCVFILISLALLLATPFIGQKLTARLIQAKTQAPNGPVGNGKDSDDLCVVAFAILLQELEALSVSEHYLQLDLVVAVYIAFADNMKVTSMFPSVPHCGILSSKNDFLDREQMDRYLGRTCRKLALGDYVHLLTTVSQSLSDIEHIPSHQLLHLVHLAALLLHEHPSRRHSSLKSNLNLIFITFLSRFTSPRPKIRHAMHQHLHRSSDLHRWACSPTSPGAAYGSTILHLPARGAPFRRHRGHLSPPLQVPGARPGEHPRRMHGSTGLPCYRWCAEHPRTSAS